ncbi:MAG TPA: potassium channel family protein [Bacillales bacterium]|nr:potassium channel family protein [Bacillales bacterium]
MWLYKTLLRMARQLSSWLIVITSAIVVFAAAAAAYLSEPETFKSPFNAFWWVMTTVTTVGYGDFYPHTFTGKLIGIFLFIFGVGIVGVLIGKIVEGFTKFNRRREEGKVNYKGKHHIVLIGWSQKAKHATEEILSSNDTVDVVLIDTLSESPVSEERFHYIQGQAAEEETLEKANLQQARSVLIFADDNIDDPQMCDGKSLIIATAVESFAPKIHSVVEIVDERHIENFHYVAIDEFILRNETISRLAVRSAFMGGISEVYRQLMSRNEGDNLYRISQKDRWKTYRDAFDELLQEGATLVADGKHLDINRRLDEPIRTDAQLYVICDEQTYQKLLTKGGQTS